MTTLTAKFHHRKQRDPGKRYDRYLASRFIAWNGVQERYTRPNMDMRPTVMVRKPIVWDVEGGDICIGEGT